MIHILLIHITTSYSVTEIASSHDLKINKQLTFQEKDKDVILLHNLSWFVLPYFVSFFSSGKMLTKPVKSTPTKITIITTL